MELKDTVEDMLSADYKKRFKAEYQQLVIRRNKLATMLKKHNNGELNFEPSCDYDLLFLQLTTMHKLGMIYEERAKTEGVDLDD